jgi:hypothetical protein
MKTIILLLLLTVIANAQNRYPTGAIKPLRDICILTNHETTRFKRTDKTHSIARINYPIDYLAREIKDSVFIITKSYRDYDSRFSTYFRVGDTVKIARDPDFIRSEFDSKCAGNYKLIRY